MFLLQMQQVRDDNGILYAKVGHVLWKDLNIAKNRTHFRKADKLCSRGHKLETRLAERRSKRNSTPINEQMMLQHVKEVLKILKNPRLCHQVIDI